MSKTPSASGVSGLHYESWAEFKGRVFLDISGSEEPQISRFLFRGQRDPSWKLVPSFYRHFGHLSEKGRRIALNNLMSRFSRYCQADPVLKGLVESDNKNQRTAFAQHSGLPTDLLDWTESPFIAAFFAIADHLQAHQTTKEFSVWVIDTFHPIWLTADPKALLPAPFTVPSWNNTRLRSQRGWFTLLDPKYTSFDSWVMSVKRGKQAIRQCIISIDSGVEPILVDLQLMGISHSSLFPDPGGWASAAFLDTMLRLGQVNRLPHNYPWNDSPR